MEKTLVPGKTYTVTTASECSVTDSNGLVLCTATAGEQKAFVATTSTITFSDDSAAVTAVFKSAPAALGMLGGGNSGNSGGGGGEEDPEEILPEGYSAVSFFENTKEQSFITDYTDENTTAWELDFQPINTNNTAIAVFSNYTNDASTLTRLTPINAYRWSYNVRTIRNKSNPMDVPCGIGMRSVVGIDPNSFYGFAQRLSPYHSPAASTNASPICLFANNGAGVVTTNIYRIFRLTFWEGENKGFEVVPCLKNGVPCFYNKVTGVDYFSEQEVQVTVGLTLTQARKLDSLLPDSGGALTITIPWEIVDINNEVTDAAVQSAITKAEQKGWTLTIKAYNK